MFCLLDPTRPSMVCYFKIHNCVVGFADLFEAKSLQEDTDLPTMVCYLKIHNSVAEIVELFEAKSLQVDTNLVLVSLAMPVPFVVSELLASVPSVPFPTPPRPLLRSIRCSMARTSTPTSPVLVSRT